MQAITANAQGCAETPANPRSTRSAAPTSPVGLSVCFRREWPWLLGILLLAGGLRLHRITDTSLRYCDGSWYVADARVWHRCARTALDPLTWRGLLKGDAELVHSRMVAHGVDFGQRYEKPSQGFTFLVAAAMFLVGDDPSAAPVTNAVLSTLGALAAWVLARRLFDARLACVSTLLLAVCPYDIVYARADLTDAAATTFLLAGTAAWVWHSGQRPSPLRGLLLTGATFGCALTCHYRSLAFPMMVGALDLARSFTARCEGADTRGSRARSIIRRWMWIGLGMCCPIMVVEALFQGAAALARAAHIGIVSGSYVLTAIHWISGIIGPQEAGTFRSDGLMVMTDYFLHWLGAPFVLLALAGFVAALRRGAETWILWIIPVGTLLTLALQRNHVARAMACTVPFVCFSAALGASAIAEWFTRRRTTWRTAVLCALLVLPISQCWRHAWRLARHTADMSVACDRIARLDAATLVPNEMMYRVHLQTRGGGRLLNGELMPRVSVGAALSWLEENGARYCVTDPQHWHFPPDSDEFRFWEMLELALRREASLIAEYPHLSDYRWEFLAEAGKTANDHKMVRAQAGPIRIYDLRPAYAARLTLKSASSTR